MKEQPQNRFPTKSF